MELSKRLHGIASLVTPGNRAVDVGCDHGYTPIWLVERGISPAAIAADVRPGPLSRAEEHIREAGLEEQIETRLSDGLAQIRPGEGESLIMSGIGGLLMIRLLSDQRETAHSFRELILSPQSDLDQVRHFLKEDGYTILRERLCREDGKYYFIFHAVPIRDERTWTEGEFTYGRDHEPESRPLVREYLQHMLSKQEGILEKLLANLAEDNERIRELRDEINRTKEYCHEMQ